MISNLLRKTVKISGCFKTNGLNQWKALYESKLYCTLLYNLKWFLTGFVCPFQGYSIAHGHFLSKTRKGMSFLSQPLFTVEYMIPKSHFRRSFILQVDSQRSR